MKQITKAFNWLVSSFDTNTKGAAARKLTAFALMVCIAYIHYKFVDKENAIQALIIDLTGVAFFLGLITVAQIIELKNGDKPKEG
jgi:hypothetical protein